MANKWLTTWSHKTGGFYKNLSAYKCKTGCRIFCAATASKWLFSTLNFCFCFCHLKSEYGAGSRLKKKHESLSGCHWMFLAYLKPIARHIPVKARYLCRKRRRRSLWPRPSFARKSRKSKPDTWRWSTAYKQVLFKLSIPQILLNFFKKKFKFYLQLRNLELTLNAYEFRTLLFSHLFVMKFMAL